METILSIIVCFFAVYGVFRLLYKCVYYYYDVKKLKTKLSHQLIVIDDNAENLEAYLRAANMKEEEVVIIDISTKPETKKLLTLIESEFSNVRVMTSDEYYLYISNSI